jgi:hypothetical protein
MTSLSTRFLGQPKLTNPTFNDLFSADEFLLYRIAASGTRAGNQYQLKYEIM